MSQNVPFVGRMSAGAGAIPRGIVEKLRHPNPVKVVAKVAAPPDPADCPLRRRGPKAGTVTEEHPEGVCQEGVYWSGKGWAYDDGQAPQKRHKWPVGAGVHPRVAANLAREEQNREQNDELLRLRAERRQLQQERAAFEREKRALALGPQ